MKNSKDTVQTPLMQVECAACGSGNIDTHWENISFEYGTQGSSTKLDANVPVHKCLVCDFQFTGRIADRMCHEVVCKHLSAMTPSEICQI